MTTLAVLPVKGFEGAKSRLDAALAPAERRALAEAMFSDVLTALRRTPGLDGVIVVSRDLSAQRIAGSHRVDVVDDLAERGQSPAAELGIARAVRRRADRVLLVPGDCPALDPQEVAELLRRPSAIVADRHGTGTNGLLLSPPEAIRPAFGEDSFARHTQRAREAGVSLEPALAPSLAIDVDTPDDLSALRDHLGAHRGGAAHTRGLLLRLDRAATVPA
jgi:2-phospho-L-lactate guanylyltransferase